MLTKLLPYLTGGLQTQASGEALSAARGLWHAEWRRAEVLVDLIPYAPKELPQEAMADVRLTRHGQFREKLLASLLPHLVVLDHEILYPLWQETLPNMTDAGRQSLLADLSIMIPVMIHLGGEEAIVESYRAIQDVGRWWP